MLTPQWSARCLVLLTVIVAMGAWFVPRIAQPESYHHFADQRAWLGVANFGDVASNAAFAVAGIWGLWLLLRKPSEIQFLDERERWPYVVLFCGLLLTAWGSAYYHLAPGNARLVWDRLPMTIAFMSLVATIIAERISVKIGLGLLPVLIAVGIVSVLQWKMSEEHGQGDLRFYAAVQIYAVLVVLLSLAMKSPYTRRFDLAMVGAFYVAAKLLETWDRQIFEMGQVVSGHTLKHLVAAAAGFWILRMLIKREPISDGSSLLKTN